ncbi:hypothetical protein S7S_02165 [Isoalcanivorax pacificus W11-5]|uniref:DUF4168 domain-containing protein n=2 Tax=Isoalcanivorax TaxID=3020833 RepID=A0A0B4XJI7_9GAMM|nr:hypothetical protein S7S_02165 [Isoalcanivorax pacificus W11-5]
MQIRLKPLVIAVAAMGLGSMAFADNAGTPQSPAPAPGAAQNQAPAAAAEVSDEELEKFAGAHKKVEEIREKYVSEAQQADDPEKVAEVQMNMQQEMVEAVQDEDLDVGTYNRIAQMLPYDDNLRQRVEGML